jgi:hypothetical protein
MRPGPESTLNAAFELTPQAAPLLAHMPPAGASGSGMDEALGPGSVPGAVVRPVSRADLPGRLKRRKIAPA